MRWEEIFDFMKYIRMNRKRRDSEGNNEIKVKGKEKKILPPGKSKGRKEY